MAYLCEQKDDGFTSVARGELAGCPAFRRRTRKAARTSFPFPRHPMGLASEAELEASA